VNTGDDRTTVMDDLAGRTAVITGAASGLGRAMAERLAAEGMRLVLADIERGPLQDVAHSLGNAATEVVTQPVDVARVEDVERLAEVAFDRFGAVHVLCNNAGVVKRARSWNLTLDDWQWVLGVDLWGVIHAVRAFVPRMLGQAGDGHIVNTASMSGLLPIPNLAAYSVAKAAVVALSEALQLDLDAEGASIGVSVLCPGFIATRITESERNRPADLADTASAPTVARTTAGVDATMDAADVAQYVVDAIRANRFWILTHDAYRDVIRDRAAGIGTDARPAPPPIW
jgi:NAD(P)-dependent dehydrogenase (short-subunit alcohol dehydrogenase family)